MQKMIKYKTSDARNLPQTRFTDDANLIALNQIYKSKYFQMKEITALKGTSAMMTLGMIIVTMSPYQMGSDILLDSTMIMEFQTR